MAHGHKWKVSSDNNRAGYWSCMTCHKTEFFMGIPDPLEGFSQTVQDWFVLHSEDQNMSCLEPLARAKE